MIFNPVAQQLIGNMGYQTAYLCLGAIMFVCFIPALALYVFKPEDKGLVPLGYEEKQAEQAAQAAADGGSGEKKEVVREGYTYKEAIRSPKFYILAFVIICLSGMSIGHVPAALGLPRGHGLREGVRRLRGVRRQPVPHVR